ncbi:MAG: MFS transporter [Lachnospiraceae bacterium]
MNKRKIKFAIYSVDFLLLSIFAISPAMSSLSAAMPDRSAAEIQMIIQLPSLMTVPFLLMGGAASKKFSRKTLLLAGLVLFLTGGTTGYFTENYFLLLISRCVLGFGIGIMNPCTVGLVSDLFFGTDEYAPTVGLENAFKSVGGVIYTILTGWLCMISWHHVFLVYLLGVPVFFSVLFFIPGITPEQSIVTEKPKEAFRVSPLLVTSVILAFFVSFCINITNSNVSYLIEDSGFGDSTFSGYAASTFTLFCVFGSVFYSKYSKRIGQKMILAAMTAGGIGLFISGMSMHIITAFIGIAILGIGNGMAVPSLMMQVGNIDKENSTLYFSFIIAAMNIGSTCQGLIVPGVAAKLFGGTGVGAGAYLVGGMVMLAAIICELGVFRMTKKRLKG